MWAINISECNQVCETSGTDFAKLTIITGSWNEAQEACYNPMHVYMGWQSSIYTHS